MARFCVARSGVTDCIFEVGIWAHIMYQLVFQIPRITSFYCESQIQGECVTSTLGISSCFEIKDHIKDA